MRTGYKVSDIMTQLPVVVAPDATLEECAKIMADKRVGTLIIKDGDKLAGVLSERDIVRKVIARANDFVSKGRNTTNLKAEEIMVTDVITIDPNKDIFDALVMMKDFDIRHLPVVHKNQLAGLLTLKDILKIQPQLFEILVEKIELREESRKPINKINDNEGICELCGNYTEDVVVKNGSMVCKKCEKSV